MAHNASQYLYRAVDKDNNTIDFLLTAKRDKKAARRFLNKDIKSSGEPVKINIDKSGANTATIESYNKDNHTNIEIRQNKYLNNIVEQDHRFIKKKVRPTLGFKKFHAAQATIAGIEAVRMILKNDLARRASCWTINSSIIGGLKRNGRLLISAIDPVKKHGLGVVTNLILKTAVEQADFFAGTMCFVITMKPYRQVLTNSIGISLREIDADITMLASPKFLFCQRELVRLPIAHNGFHYDFTQPFLLMGRR